MVRRFSLVFLCIHQCLIADGYRHLQSSAQTADLSHIAGTYSDMTYVEEAGDWIGTEIVITFNGVRYEGTVEIAQGVRATPVPVTIEVSGRKIRFSVTEPDVYASEFSGEIRHGVLRGEFRFKNGAKDSVKLPKRPEVSKRKQIHGIREVGIG